MKNILEVHLKDTRDHVPAKSAKYLSYKYHRPYKLNELINVKTLLDLTNDIKDEEDAEIDLLNNSLNISNAVFIQPSTQTPQSTSSSARNIIHSCADN